MAAASTPPVNNFPEVLAVIPVQSDFKAEVPQKKDFFTEVLVSVRDLLVQMRLRIKILVLVPRLLERVFLFSGDCQSNHTSQ